MTETAIAPELPHVGAITRDAPGQIVELMSAIRALADRICDSCIDAAEDAKAIMALANTAGLLADIMDIESGHGPDNDLSGWILPPNSGYALKLIKE